MHGLDYMQLTIEYREGRWRVMHRGAVVAEGATTGSIAGDAHEIEVTLERRWRHSTQRERDSAR